MPRSEVADPGLVDKNVLVYAVYPAAPQHPASRALIDQATAENPQYLAPQVLAEFYAVVTDSRRVSQARQPDEALDAIEQFIALPGLVLLPSPPDLSDPLAQHRPPTASDLRSHL